jgi:hypothetical protein
MYLLEPRYCNLKEEVCFVGLYLEETMDLSQIGLRSEYNGRFKWPELYTVMSHYALILWIIVKIVSSHVLSRDTVKYTHICRMWVG